MMLQQSLLLLAAWLFVRATALPYIPTTALRATHNSSLVYVFQPASGSSPASLVTVNASTSITPNSPVTTLSSSLPFLVTDTEETSFTPYIDSNENIYALAGQCAQGASNASLWTLKEGKDEEQGNWVQANLSVSGFQDGDTANSGGINFLGAGFVFSSPPDHTPTLYFFGGMCPNASVSSLSSSTWQQSANYSNLIMSATPQGLLSSSSFASVASKDDQFKLSPATSSRGPPIAEAGFSATGLLPLIDGPNNTNVQQNIVLLGGQTQEAFINMSQLAMMSLPEQSWSFIPINSPQGSSNELARRQASTIEPRSGHTAVLSEDGKKIIVLGGWVGDINTPAEPQMAVLEVGAKFGGVGDWQWSTPSFQGIGPSGNGIYGHGAVMLPGNVMMITGGTTINGKGSKAKRDAMGIHFLNVTSNSWSTSYANPSATQVPNHSSQASHGLSIGSKIGLGVGLGLGIPLFFIILGVVFCCFVRKRRKDKRRSDIIDRALSGSDNLTGGSRVSFHDSPQSMVERNSRGSRNPFGQTADERPSSEAHNNGWRNVQSMDAERTGLLVEIPSPTRGLRRGHSREKSYGAESTSRASMQIPVIDEMDENDEDNEHHDGRDDHDAAAEPQEPEDSPFKLPELDLGVAFAAPKSPPPKAKSPPPKQNRARALSDPFADPMPNMPSTFDSAPTSLNASPNELPDRNSKGWIEDWETVQRNIQQQESANRSSGTISSQRVNAARVSPVSHRSGGNHSDRSDRTRSNISDKSMHSAVSFMTNKSGRSDQSLNRNMSQRSTNIFSVLPHRQSKKPGRSSLPQPGTVSTAVASIEGTPPGQQRSPPTHGRSIALSPPQSADNSPRYPRMPSFGTLQSESKALLGNPRSGATPATTLGSGAMNIEGYAAEHYMDADEEDDEFPRRPNQRRSRGLMGSIHNVLGGGRSRHRLNTGVGSISSIGAPTIATASSNSPTRASTSTPFSMLRGAGGQEAAAAAAAAETTAQPDYSNSNYNNEPRQVSSIEEQMASSRPRRTASVGSAPWRRRRSGARDWNWADGSSGGVVPGEAVAAAAAQDRSTEASQPSRLLVQPPSHHRGGSSSAMWRRSSPGAVLTSFNNGNGNGSISGRSETGGEWDVESAVEQRCVQVMFTVPRERLRVVNASDDADNDADTDAASVRTGLTGRSDLPGHADSILDMYVDRKPDDDEIGGGGGGGVGGRSVSGRSVQMRGCGRGDLLGVEYDDDERAAFARQPSMHRPGRGSPGLW